MEIKLMNKGIIVKNVKKVNKDLEFIKRNTNIDNTNIKENEKWDVDWDFRDNFNWCIPDHKF